MTGNVWTTFLVLLADLIVGYEIGKAVMARKIGGLLKQLSETLKESAEKLKQDQEQVKIERAAQMDEMREQIFEALKESSKKEGDTVEGNKNS